MSDAERVMIRDALDEAPVDLRDLPIKLVRCQRDISNPRRNSFFRTAHDDDCVWNDTLRRDTVQVLGLRLEGI